MVRGIGSALSKSKYSNYEHYESAEQKRPHQIRRPRWPSVLFSIPQVVFGNHRKKVEGYIIFPNITQTQI